RDPSGHWHYIGAHGSARNQSSTSTARSWTCSQCHHVNTSPKACQTCGLKRTYGEVVKNGPKPSTPPTAAPQQNPVRAQLSTITDTLTKLHESPTITSPAERSLAKYPVHSQGDVLTKAQLQARVKQLEHVLATIPEEDDAELASERISLTTRLDDYKRQIVGSKPIGARIDGTRAALGRARARREEAEQALKASTLLVKQSTDEVTALEAELSELEASLAADPMAAEAFAPASHAFEILNQMIEHLKKDEHVHPGHVQAATQHVQQLFEGFQATLNQAVATRAAAAGVQPTPAGYSVKAMATAAATPATVRGPAGGSLVRHHGKQKHRELITDYFTKRKVVKSITKVRSPRRRLRLCCAWRRAANYRFKYTTFMFMVGGAAYLSYFRPASGTTCGPELLSTVPRAASEQTTATGNVCTFRPQEESAAGVQVAFQLMLGKVQILEQYFIGAHLDYVFLQEGRARVEEVRTGLHYTMYVGAGDDDGGHGCQIWIRARSGFKVSSHAAVSPRLFWLTGRDACGLPLILVSARAPTEASPAIEREGFWDTLLSTMSPLQRRAPTAKISMGIDANARVGPRHSGATVPRDPEEISQNGAALIATLQELQLAALNTLFNVGYTWRSGKGPTSRIDYLCGPLVDLPAVHKVYVPERVQLSITTREDHRMVAAHMTAPTRGGDTVGPPAPFRFNKWRLGDTACAQQVARRMSELRLSTHGDIDDKTTTFMDHVRSSALQALGRPQDQPRQPWISGDTWRLLRTLAPSRRTMYRARAEIFKAHCHLAFLSWSPLCPSAFSMTNAPPTRSGWAAKCAPPSLRALRQQWRLLNAATTRLCSQLTLFLETKAQEAQLAAVRRDWCTTFGVVRALSGRSASSSTHPVRLESGALSSTEAERQGRWQEHFRDVFNGKPVTMAELKLKPTPPPDPFTSGIVVLPDAAGASLLQLGRNKGAGRDGAPSELLAAGGDAVNEPLASIFQDIIDGERWPTSWTGGRMQNVCKKKGPREERDESCGIALEDHAAKGFKQPLSGLVTPMCNAHMGLLLGLSVSCFVWFVDLVKAFDRVVREIVLGWPHAATDPEQYLRDLGLSDHQAQWIATWVARRGCLFEQWGVSPKVIRLLKNTRAASWFSYGDCDTTVATLVGGRQGCKYGATVFNCTFSLAMVLIRDAVLDAGIILRLPKGRDAFWAPPESGTDHAEDTMLVVDAAFVDDECFILTAPRAADLDSAINAILTAVCNIYESVNLAIN
ncbi:unnamed protein product, partial [Prorocentrum cordatum]